MKNTVIAMMFLGLLACLVCIVHPKPLPKPTEVIATMVTPTPVVINEAAVVSTVKGKALLTGLEAVAHKTFVYEDTIKGYGIDSLTRRSFTVNFDARFLIGIDTARVKVVTKGDTVIVMLPELVLISVEPRDIGFDGNTGLLRSAMTDGEKAWVLGLAMDAVRAEVMNPSNREQAVSGIKDGMTKLLKGIDGVRTVEFL